MRGMRFVGAVLFVVSFVFLAGCGGGGATEDSAEDVVQAVLTRVGELGAGPVELITTVEEDVTFSIPPALRKDVDALRQAAGAGSAEDGQ